MIRMRQLGAALWLAVVIEAADWPGLRRIEAEDLEGMVDKPRDMQLCIASTSG